MRLACELAVCHLYALAAYLSTLYALAAYLSTPLLYGIAILLLLLLSGARQLSVKFGLG